MGTLNGWDVLLLAGAIYIAVMTLVRMMARRRDQVVADVERQLEVHRKQSKASKDKKSRDAA
jgi:hypothetical protein